MGGEWNFFARFSMLSRSLPVTCFSLASECVLTRAFQQVHVYGLSLIVFVASVAALTNYLFCFKVEFPDYSPVSYTAPVVLKKPPWADPDLMSM